MKHATQHLAQLVVFLMVNRVIGQPFYVGLKRARVSGIEPGNETDVESRRAIIAAIHGAGRRVQNVAVARVSDLEQATRAELHWVRTLLHGGIDVVNYLAPAQAQ